MLPKSCTCMLEISNKGCFYICDSLATHLPLPLSLPYGDYETTVCNCSMKKSCDIIIITKTNKLVRNLTLTTLVSKVVENMVVKTTPNFSG